MASGAGIKPRVLMTSISLDDGTASLEVAGYFELGAREARQIAADVGKAVASWRRAAAKLGIAKAEIDRMASAFEHQDAKAARR
jgi:serine/threonine-protein kinase HipA